MMELFDIGSYTPVRSEDEMVKVVPTDLKPLNEKLGGGLMTGQFYVFQAPSGGGKTTMLLRMFYNVIMAGHKAAYVSMGEQTSKELYEKLICLVEGQKFPMYLQADNDFRTKKFEVFTSYLKEKINNIYIYYTENPYTLRAKNPEKKPEKPEDFTTDFNEIMHDIRKKGIQFIFVDYMGADCSTGDNTNRYEQLKLYCDQLAHESDKNNKCIVTAMQMNRTFSNYLRSKDFDPYYVGQEFTADSIGAIHKVKVGISFFKHKDKDGNEQQYFNVFKNRTFGDLGPIKVRVTPDTFRWCEDGEMGFEF